MRSMCTVDLHVTANNINILNIAKKCFYGDFITTATIKRT